MTKAGQPGSNLTGAGLALASMATYAAHDAAIKFLGASFSPFQILFLIALFGLPPLVLRLRAEGGLRLLWPRQPLWVAARTLGMTIAVLGATAAFSALPLAQVYAILFATPLLITALSVPLLGERVGPHRWAAVAVGMAGVLVVLQPGQAALSWAHAAAVAAAMGNAGAAVISRRLGHGERASVLILWPVLLNLAVGCAALPWVWLPMTGAQIGLALLVAVLSLAGATMNLLAYRAAEAAVVAPMQYSQMLWAALWGWLLFSETPRQTTLVGVALIMASGLYILWRETRPGVSRHAPVIESDRTGEATPTATATRTPPM